jgi:tetratricopeptide (TPR) repeat protein
VALGKYTQAESLYLRVLSLYEDQVGADHLRMATSLNNLAIFYQRQREYGEAESLYRRALAIREQQSGPDHLDTVFVLNNLASLYHSQRKFAK